MDYTPQLEAYKVLVNQLVGSKVSEDSIDPTDVAAIGIQLADLLIPILNTINDFGIDGGTLPPDNADGNNLDLYVQGGTSIIFWRKRNGIWQPEAGVELGIQIVDGNINLQASVVDYVITVSAGSWGINNTIYSKAVQTQFTISDPDLNFDRIDTVTANTAGDILLLIGTASINPTPVDLPDNSVVVSYVYVPSEASDNLPYIADSNASPSTIISDTTVSLTQTWSSYKINRIPQPWTNEPTPLYGVRWKEIDGVFYEFFSLVVDNVSEPSLTSSASWFKTDFKGLASQFDNSTTYNAGTYITGDANKKVYRSKVSNNTGNTPSGGITNEFWQYIGNYRGRYFAGFYNLGDFVYVLEDGNQTYYSLKAENEDPLTAIGGSTWQLIGFVKEEIPDSKTVLTFTQSDLVLEYEGAYYLPFNMPAGKTFVNCEILSAGNYRYLSADLLSKQSAWPTHRLSGFDNNDAQTITLTFI